MGTHSQTQRKIPAAKTTSYPNSEEKSEGNFGLNPTAMNKLHGDGVGAALIKREEANG